MEDAGAIDPHTVLMSTDVGASSFEERVTKWRTDLFLRTGVLSVQPTIAKVDPSEGLVDHLAQQVNPDTEQRIIVKMRVKNWSQIQDMMARDPLCKEVASCSLPAYLCVNLLSHPLELFAMEEIVCKECSYACIKTEKEVLICDAVTATAIKELRLTGGNLDSKEARSLEELKSTCGEFPNDSAQLIKMSLADEWIDKLQIENLVNPKGPSVTVLFTKKDPENYWEERGLGAMITMYSPSICNVHYHRFYRQLSSTSQFVLRGNINTYFDRHRFLSTITNQDSDKAVMDHLLGEGAPPYELQSGHGKYAGMKLKDAVKQLEVDLKTSDKVMVRHSIKEYGYSSSWGGYNLRRIPEIQILWKPEFTAPVDTRLQKHVSSTRFCSLHQDNEKYGQLVELNNSRKLFYTDVYVTGFRQVTLMMYHLLKAHGVDPVTITQQDFEQMLTGDESPQVEATATSTSAPGSSKSTVFSIIHRQLSKMICCLDVEGFHDFSSDIRLVSSLITQVTSLPWSTQEREEVTSSLLQLASRTTTPGQSGDYVFNRTHLALGFQEGLVESKLQRAWKKIADDFGAQGSYRSGNLSTDDELFEAHLSTLTQRCLSIYQSLPVILKEANVKQLFDCVGNEFLKAYESYVDLTALTGPHGCLVSKLMRNFAILAYPMLPIIAEYVWSIGLKQKLTLMEHSLGAKGHEFKPLIEQLHLGEVDSTKLTMWNYITQTINYFKELRLKERAQPTAAYVYTAASFTPWQVECLSVLKTVYQPSKPIDRRQVANLVKPIALRHKTDMSTMMKFVSSKITEVEAAHKAGSVDLSSLLTSDTKINELEVLTARIKLFQKLLQVEEVIVFSVSDHVPPDPQGRLALTKVLAPQLGFDFRRLRGKVQVIANVQSDTKVVKRTPLLLDAKNNKLFMVETSKHCVYQLDLSSNTVSVFAGKDGSDGYVNGSVRDALFSSPCCAVFSSNGEMLIGEHSGGVSRVRLIDASRSTVSTLAEISEPRMQIVDICVKLERSDEHQEEDEEMVYVAMDHGVIYKLTSMSQLHRIEVSSVDTILSIMPHPSRAHGLLVCEPSNGSKLSYVYGNYGRREIKNYAGGAGEGFFDAADARRAMMRTATAICTSTKYMFLCDTGNNAIRVVGLVNHDMLTLSGKSTTTGNMQLDGEVDAVKWDKPTGIAVDERNGVVYVRDSTTIRRIVLKGLVDNNWRYCNQLLELQSTRCFTDLAVLF